MGRSQDALGLWSVLCVQPGTGPQCSAVPAEWLMRGDTRSDFPTLGPLGSMDTTAMCEAGVPMREEAKNG